MTNSKTEITDARAFRFVGLNGEPLNSTDFAKSILSQAIASIDSALAARIGAEANWRKNYQGYFLELARVEFKNRNQGFDFANLALGRLGAQIVDQRGESLAELARAGFFKSGLVQTVRIKGSGQAQGYWPSEPASAEGDLVARAKQWIERGLAEPDVAKAFSFLQANPNLPIAGDLLIALAGNAELAATRDWLSIGGRVAVVARPNERAWHELIEHARNSAGELFICIDARQQILQTASDAEIANVAGLNLVSDIDLVASWVHELSRSENRIVIASYSYVGGSKQIITQAAQDSVVAVASENVAKSKLAISYLATPLDVVVASGDLASKQLAAHDLRSRSEKLRDAIFGWFGQLKVAKPVVTDGESFTIFDASSVRQGSSYLLAKHSEKWRAMVSARRGTLVSFTVAPPARTRSVLNTKILNKTYRGLPTFGVEPFTSAETRRAMALLLLRNLHDSESPAAPANSAADPVGLVSATAIHGGIWRLGYQPDTVWVAATLIGNFAKK